MALSFPSSWLSLISGRSLSTPLPTLKFNVNPSKKGIQTIFFRFKMVLEFVKFDSWLFKSFKPGMYFILVDPY